MNRSSLDNRAKSPTPLATDIIKNSRAIIKKIHKRSDYSQEPQAGPTADSRFALPRGKETIARFAYKSRENTKLEPRAEARFVARAAGNPTRRKTTNSRPAQSALRAGRFSITNA
jgi:hypothetical protein